MRYNLRYCVLTSLSLSAILTPGSILRPPVMLRVAPILYHIRDLGCESTTWEGIHESTISSRFLGLILRFLWIKVSTLVFAFLQNGI